MEMDRLSVLARFLNLNRPTRRDALAMSGFGIAAGALSVASGPLTPAATAREGTPFPTTPVPDGTGQPESTTAGLAGLAFENVEFDGQFLRVLDGVYYGCADVGESFVTARRITPDDHDSWLAEWNALADRIYAAGVASRDGGHRVSAREAFHRASTYYRNAGVFLFRAPLEDGFVASYERQRDAFRQAAELADTPIESVEIPYEGTTLPGYFLTPAGLGPFPTLVITDGYDGTVEELYQMGGLAAVRRGYAVLMVDGPGQGSALLEQGLTFRPDWEAVVTPQIDWLLARPEIDPKRIALMGRSWGGYLAPRAATAEHRIAALIADAAQYAPGEAAIRLLPEEYQGRFAAGDADEDELNEVLLAAMAENPYLDFAIRRGLLTHGVERPIQYLRAYVPFTIAGLADRITCPTLIIEAENDVRGGDARPLYDAIVAPKEYLLFTNAEGAGEHDESGAASLFAQRVFDWLDTTLAAVE